MSDVRRGTVLSFDSSAWTALVTLDGADTESQIPVGQWVEAQMMTAAAEVAVLVFGGTNTDDGVVLGPYGALGIQNLATVSSPTFAGITLTGDLVGAGRIETAHGAWTPVFTGSGTPGAFTYSKQVGTYVKIGKLVYIYGSVAISAIGTPPTGSMTITGLPFTSHATDFGAVVFASISQLKFAAGNLQLTGRVGTNGTSITLIETFTNAGAAAFLAANFTNAATDLIFNGWYEIP